MENKTDYEEIFDRMIWEDKIKDVCFLCGGSIPKTWQHYFTMGNCCGVCSGWTSMSQLSKKACRIKDLVTWRSLTPNQRLAEKARIAQTVKK